MFEEARGKKLLIIGAETNIMHIVTQAKEMGVYTIVTERGSDYSTTSAKSIADEAWDIDYSDLETLVQQSQRVGINGVISGYSEGKVLYAARLSQLLQTPFYVTPEQIELTRNKRHFKELCSEYGVPIPIDYCPSGSIDSLIGMLSNIQSSSNRLIMVGESGLQFVTVRRKLTMRLISLKGIH